MTITEPSAPFPPYTITREVTAMIVLATRAVNEIAIMIGREIFLAGKRHQKYILHAGAVLHELKFYF